MRKLEELLQRFLRWKHTFHPPTLTMSNRWIMDYLRDEENPYT